MTARETGTIPLQFIFTKDGFYCDAQGILPEADEPMRAQFTDDRWGALYHMGLRERRDDYGPSAVFLYMVSDAFFKALTSLPELELLREQAIVPEPEFDRLLMAVPFVIGAEYIDENWIRSAFRHLNEVFAREIAAYHGTVSMYLTEQSQQLRVPERIFFHLVEDKDPEFPFAFLATYATRDENGRVRHVPLKFALTEYKNRREKLLELLSCLNRAAEASELIGSFMKSGEMFHPLRLTAAEAYDFLRHVEAIEEAGILCRIPNWWKKRSSSVSLSVRLGEKKPSFLGFDTLVSVQPELIVDGVPLTKEDIEELLAQTDGLAFLKGKWVEVDHGRLKALLKEMEELPSHVTLMDAMQGKLESGPRPQADVGPLLTNGAWLSAMMMSLKRPESIKSDTVPDSFHATLRPYQENGFTWLNYMDRLGFGACLADDMGLGKTVQVLAYLEKLRLSKKNAHVLLIVPASLLGNWKRETENFAPSLPFKILHGKKTDVLEEEIKAMSGGGPEGGGTFLTVTTYGMAMRLKGLQDVDWDCVILDEAQAIKNPVTKQTREIKKLNARMRIAMTGTPVENDLTNLWSLFDFLDKGLLGTSREFKSYCAGLSYNPEGYAKLKGVISPFLLRRVKTDKWVIADLPDKLEIIDHVALTKKQAVLYRKVVADAERRLRDCEGMERRGIVLGLIMKLKQICNHPDQYLGQTAFPMEESGKLIMLKDLCETIREKRERVLVFTQFREITDHLAAFLEDVFQAKGFVLHGGTPVAKRTEIVEAFQGEQYVPFVVLSVKAGGTGLNLTKANHVIHFDRWWNPAVENQATDRAYRIGQSKDVMVHKLVCEGTIEEKIDAMIESKKELTENVIGSGSEKWITELDNDELMSLLRLG